MDRTQSSAVELRPSPSSSPSTVAASAPPPPKVAEKKDEQEWYDPSKESWATRLGVNWESFKRAPGATACVPSRSLSPLRVEAEINRRADGCIDQWVGSRRRTR